MQFNFLSRILAWLPRQRSVGAPTRDRRADTFARTSHPEQPIDRHPTRDRQPRAVQQQIRVQDGGESLGPADRGAVHAWYQSCA